MSHLWHLNVYATNKKNYRHTHIHMHTHPLTHRHTRMYIYTYKHKIIRNMNIYTYTHTYLHTYTRKHPLTYMHVPIHGHSSLHNMHTDLHKLSLGKQSFAQTVKNPPAALETRVAPWVAKIPWRRERWPTPLFMAGEFLGQRSLAGYSPWGH